MAKVKVQAQNAQMEVQAHADTQALEWQPVGQVVEASVPFRRVHRPSLEALDVSNWAGFESESRRLWASYDGVGFVYLYLSRLLYLRGSPSTGAGVLGFSVREVWGTNRLTALVGGIRLIDGLGLFVPLLGQAYLKANRIDTRKALKFLQLLDTAGVRSRLQVKVPHVAYCEAHGFVCELEGAIGFVLVPSPSSSPVCDYLLNELKGVVKM